MSKSNSFYIIAMSGLFSKILFTTNSHSEKRPDIFLLLEMTYIVRLWGLLRTDLDLLSINRTILQQRG